MSKSFLAPEFTILNEPSFHGEIRIKPGETVSIQFVLQAKHVGLDKENDVDPTKLEFHTRSYLAQAGVFFEPDTRQLTVELMDKLRAGETVIIQGTVKNLGPCVRILKTDNHAAVGRFLYLCSEDKVTGKKLIQVARLGKDQQLDKDKQKIELELSSQDEILVTEHDDVVVLDGSRVNWVNHTKKLPLALHKGEPTHAFSLCVTSGIVKIPCGYFGWLQEQTSEPGVRHLKSQLLEPGTDWRVRVELLAEGASQRIPKSVYLNLYRVDDYPARTDGNTFKDY